MPLGTTHGSGLPSVQAASLSSCVASVNALAPRCRLQIHNKQTRMMQIHKQLLLRDTNTRAQKPPLGTYKNVCTKGSKPSFPVSKDKKFCCLFVAARKACMIRAGGE